MPREGSEGWIGMLLTRSKLDEVVSQFKYPLNLHPDLLDIILGWPVGHVGAVVEMLHIISSEASCFCLITLFPRSQRKHFLTLHTTCVFQFLNDIRVSVQVSLRAQALQPRSLDHYEDD